MTFPFVHRAPQGHEAPESRWGLVAFATGKFQLRNHRWLKGAPLGTMGFQSSRALICQHQPQSRHSLGRARALPRPLWLLRSSNPRAGFVAPQFSERRAAGIDQLLEQRRVSAMPKYQAFRVAYPAAPPGLRPTGRLEKLGQSVLH